MLIHRSTFRHEWMNEWMNWTGRKHTHKTGTREKINLNIHHIAEQYVKGTCKGIDSDIMYEYCVIS